MRTAVAIVGVLLATLFVACTKEPAIEPLPLAGFVVYDVVPVRAVNLPSGGVAILCKRSIDDPVLASALLFNGAGTLTSRMDFERLPSTVENIAFGAETWSITDLVPMDDGTFLLIGLGRQTDLEDRLHLVVYRADASGNAIGAPVRRYVADQSVMVRADDVDELYLTKALGALRADGRLVVTVRYDRLEDPLTIPYHRTFQIGLTGEEGNYAGPSIQMVTGDLQLRHVLADGQGGTYTLLDIPNSTIGTNLRVEHATWGEQTITGIQHGVLPLRDAEPSSVLVHDGALVMAGNYQVEADVRRPFFTRATTVTELLAGTVLPDIGGSDRSAIIRALVPDGSGFTAVCNVYEQQVLSIGALRDDRFCDLTSATLAPDGSLLSTRDIIAGKGLHALGAWGGGAGWIAGSFHPFLNTDYMHGFVVQTTAQ